MSVEAEWRLFTEGDDLYDAMCEDIAQARASVRMESYIFASDEIGRRIARALSQQAGRGRQVRLRLDRVGSALELDAGLWREMLESGVQLEWSRAWRWSAPWSFHRRNHRKLLIVDEAIAYLGGFNIHAKPSRRLSGEARWRDTHVRFTGPAVGEAVELFDSGSSASCHREPVGPFWLLPSGSRQCQRILRCEWDRALSRAASRIWLTTPYFVPDRRLRRRLVAAARQGVDVCVMTPARSDVSLVQWAARAVYGPLLQAGVRVYEYQPRVLHAKTMLVDESWATVGSANFDYRSMFLNSEVNLVAIDRDFCESLARQFRTDLQSSRPVLPHRWRLRGGWDRLREWLAWRVRRWL